MSAKEMFEKLGYELTLDNEYGIIYEEEYEPESQDEITRIIFDKKCKTFYKNNYIGYAKEIFLEELQAINKPVEELGW